MKIDAGLKLYSRKPAQAPPDRGRRARASSCRPDAAKSAAIASAAIAATPAARPSMLSSRLKALVEPTSHRMASSVSSQTMPVTGSRSPKDTATAAMTSWAVSFVCGLKRAQVVEQAEHDTRGSADRETGERRRRCPADTRPPAAPAAMARPPISGIGRRCQRSPRGRATSPRRRASGAQRNAAAAVSIAAASAVTTRSTVGDITGPRASDLRESSRPDATTRTPRSASRR